MSVERAKQVSITPSSNATSPSWLPPAEFGAGLRQRNEASIARLLEVRDKTEALHELLDALVAGPWSFGAIWTLSDERWSCVRTSACVSEATVTLSQLGISAGPSLLDRAARGLKVVFRRWLPIDASCPLEAAAREAGFVSAAAYALTGADAILGVVTVFSKKERRPEHFGTAEQNLVRCAGLLYALSGQQSGAPKDAEGVDLLGSLDYEVDSGVFQSSNPSVQAQDALSRAADTTQDDDANAAALIPSLFSAPLPRLLDDESTAFTSGMACNPDQVARAVHAVNTAIAQLTATLLGKAHVVGPTEAPEPIISERSDHATSADAPAFDIHGASALADMSVDEGALCAHLIEGTSCSEDAHDVVDPVRELSNYTRHLLALVQ